MKKTLLITIICGMMAAGTAIAQAPPGSLWYNGDFNGINGLANERNTLVTQAAVYDDFNVTAPLGWNVTAVFSDNLLNTIVTAADWEIRTDISEGNAGTLIASGTTNSPIVTIINDHGEFIEYRVEVIGLNAFLPTLPSGQHYWLNVTPVGNGTGRSFNTTTSGANCVGTPCGNDQSAFFNSTFFGTYFTSTANESQPSDFSNGVIGTVVPEPAAIVLLICGLGALLITLRRRRALLRAALPALFVTAAFALNATAIAQAPPGSLWYNGDFDGVNGAANERNTLISQAAVYEDFNVTTLGWDVTAVFSDNLASTVITGADWEIRAGISYGNAGTLIASGTTNSPVVTPTGRRGFGYTEFMVEVTGLNVTLAPGHYWLNVTPVGNFTGRSFNTTTSGTNCVGSPCGADGNAFYNSTYFGYFFVPCLDDCEGPVMGYSNGVIGTVVPEPATWALLTCGLGALLIAVRRHRGATLCALFIAAALALNTTAIAQAPPGSLWYNGDWNMVNALANERNTFYTQAAVYDDFNVTAPMWNVTAVFSDNLANTVITGADWEIRTGISEGNAGTLIATGTTNSPIVTATGRCDFGMCESMVEVTGLNVFLPMLPSGQHYWLNVTPVGNGTSRSFNTTTSGANCVGTPCGNDQNAFFNSTSFGYYFTSTGNPNLGQPYDFSNGVIGNVVPEPGTIALLTCGLGALLIAVRRRRAA